MNPVQFHAPPVSQPQAPPPPWFSPLPPNPPSSSSFWNPRNVHDRLSELQDTLNLAHALQEELEVLMRIKNGESNDDSCVLLSKYLKERKTDCKSQELASVNAANSLISKLRAQIEPFRFVTDEAVPWDEKSAVMKLSNKMLKSKRNKLWRKRKRRRIAEARTKEDERFEEADNKADEWIAKEVAKGAAQIKMEKMKKIAKDKANEERKRLESELELVLTVEKLQELRSIRIQKLKKQGHFLPEEDDKFLEKVRAAVEEEERQAMAAADTDAAKDAIANAEETQKTNHSQVPHAKDSTGDNNINETKDIKDQVDEANDSRGPSAEANPHTGNESDAQPSGGSFGSVSNLPLEFYHYYYGSNNDMGTLIEVRRAWDAYIRPGGSRIPGHWIQPPPPTDDLWASYLIRPNNKMS